MSEEFAVHLGGFQPGTLLAGYRLEAQVGAGGMAVVFRARDERLGRPVALKIMAPALAMDKAYQRRFIAESRAAARVDDPHIIPIYEAGESGGVLFIAMRFVQGGDLGNVLEQEGALPPDRAAGFISQVASALDAAHAAGLVHRDVKPANILVDARAGRPDHTYLSDFGASKGAMLSSVSVAGGLTGAKYVGTPYYSAPEQIDGLPVDGRADQYALACVAFQLLTGRVPFERDQPTAVLLAHLSAPRPSLVERRSDLPDTVDPVVAKAMAKLPAERYESCGDFADELREALGLTPYHARGPLAPHVERPPTAPPSDVSPVAGTPTQTATPEHAPSRTAAVTPPASLYPATQLPDTPPALLHPATEVGDTPPVALHPATQVAAPTPTAPPPTVVSSPGEVLAPAPEHPSGQADEDAEVLAPSALVAGEDVPAVAPEADGKPDAGVAAGAGSGEPAQEAHGSAEASVAIAEAPGLAAEAPEALTEAPDIAAEAPEAPAEEPDAAQAPEASAEALDVVAEAPELSAEAPDVVAEAPEVPVEAPEAVTPAPEPASDALVIADAVVAPDAPVSTDLSGVAAPTEAPAVPEVGPEPGSGDDGPPKARRSRRGAARRPSPPSEIPSPAAVPAAPPPAVADSGPGEVLAPAPERPGGDTDEDVPAPTAAVVADDDLAEAESEPAADLEAGAGPGEAVEQDAVAPDAADVAVGVPDVLEAAGPRGVPADGSVATVMPEDTPAGPEDAPEAAAAAVAATAAPPVSLPTVAVTDVAEKPAVAEQPTAVVITRPDRSRSEGEIAGGTASVRVHRRRLALTALIFAVVGAAVAVPLLMRGPASSPKPPNSPGAVNFRRVALDLPSNYNNGFVSSLAFSPTSKTLAIAHRSGGICLWDMATNGCTVGLAGAWSVAFSPDGQILATGDANTGAYVDDPTNGIIRLWNVATGKLTATFTDPSSQGALSLAFSPDGKTLAVGDRDGATYLWNVATGQLIHAPLVDPNSQGISGVAFSPDGKTLAVSDVNGCTYLWNVATGRPVTTLIDPGSQGVDAAVFSPDGQILATGDNNGHIYLWSSVTWRRTAAFSDPGSKGADSVAFSPDGKTLAAGDVNGRIYVWSVVTGKLAHAPLIDPGSEGINAVLFSPNGKTLATGDENGDVYAW